MPLAHDAYERLALHEAIDASIALCAQGNQYLEKTEPWHLFKVGVWLAVVFHATCLDQTGLGFLWNDCVLV